MYIQICCVYPPNSFFYKLFNPTFLLFSGEKSINILCERLWLVSNVLMLPSNLQKKEYFFKNNVYPPNRKTANSSTLFLSCF